MMPCAPVGVDTHTDVESPITADHNVIFCQTDLCKLILHLLQPGRADYTIRDLGRWIPAGKVERDCAIKCKQYAATRNKVDAMHVNRFPPGYIRTAAE